LADPSWISRLVKAFDDPKVAAAFGMIEPLEGNPLEKFFLTYSVRIAAPLFNWLGLDYVYGSNLAMRRSAFDKIGGFNIYLHTAEDTDVIHRIRAQGKIIFVPNALVHYSIRRIQNWGYPKYLWFHTKNFFQTYLFKKPATHYEAVR
jgi:GT2 family glycosyltransferase